MTKQCTKCGELKLLSEFNKDKKTKDSHNYWCRTCQQEAATKWSRNKGHLPMTGNKDCTSYLGVAVAEGLIRHLFNDVVRMAYGNKGFDFICNHGKKIDVKSACISLNENKYPRWTFGINKNKIADYFLLLAFNNREDLEPMHQWLIPGNVLNHLTTTTIAPSTINKWDAWCQPIGPALDCCNAMKYMPTEEKL